MFAARCIHEVKKNSQLFRNFDENLIFSKFQNIFQDLHFDGWFQTVLNSRYTEWVKPVMDFLIDQKRVVIEVRISDDWQVEVHAHGRKVYPESLQISHVDHSINGVKEVIRVRNLIFLLNPKAVGL